MSGKKTTNEERGRKARGTTSLERVAVPQEVKARGEVLEGGRALFLPVVKDQPYLSSS